MNNSPNRVLAWPYLVSEFVLLPMIPVMREKHGTAFTILADENVAARYRPILGSNDAIEIIPPLDFTPDALAFEKAQKHESDLGVNYMRDIIQSDRFHFTRMSSVAPRSAFALTPDRSLVEITSAINKTFDWLGGIFDKHDPDLVLAWPFSLETSCCVHLATSRGILATYPLSAKLGRRALWASGPYMSDFQHRAAYNKTGLIDPIAIKDIEAPAQAAQLTRGSIGDLYSARRIMTDVAKIVFERSHHTLLNAMKGGRYRPVVSLTQAILLKLKTLPYHRRFVSLCSDIADISKRPFYFFAFHQEPEIVVQSLSKDFNDQRAIVRHIALSMPAGTSLVIKEHAVLGYRDLDYYKELLSFPNVLMADPNIPGHKLAEQSIGVLSLRGTVTLEAGLYGKRAAVFVDNTEFAFLPHVTYVASLLDLPDLLSQMCKPLSVETKDNWRRSATRFREAIKSISFQADPLFERGAKMEHDDVVAASDLLVDVMQMQPQRTSRPIVPPRRPL